MGTKKQTWGMVAALLCATVVLVGAQQQAAPIATDDQQVGEAAPTPTDRALLPAADAPKEEASLAPAADAGGAER
ncbi:MAG: hypothetical protein ACYSVY_20365, partial [Planctomycetota bacterium]